MRHTINWYKPLLFLLRGLIYGKRALFWVLGLLWSVMLRVNGTYKMTLGFVLYKTFFYIKKWLHKFAFTKKESKMEIFGRRGTLQFFLFLVLFVIMLPHSKLYSKQQDGIAGRKTLLYKLAGSSDSEIGYDEITLALAAPQESQVLDAWKQGAIISQPGSSNSAVGIQDISGISAGGSALTKPIIAPGAQIGQLPNGVSQTSDRTKATEYVVQPGDVIGSIAQRFGVSVNTILWENNLSVRSYIRPGDTLTILPVDGVAHIVKRGETIAKIARVYDASAQDIISFNNLEEGGSDIIAGEELVIPGGEKPQPTPVYSAPIVTNRPSSFDTVVAPKPSVTAPAGSGYLWPTDASRITQYFGWRHGGLDIGGPVGTPIYATKAGTVSASQCGWNWGYGCYVQINHGNGIETIYAHNSELLVAVGDEVSQGQQISKMGSTGQSTGPHLHFEVHISGSRQNPLAYIRK